MAITKLKLMAAPGGKNHTRRLLKIERNSRFKKGEDFSLPLSGTRAVLFSVGDAKFMVVPCEESEVGQWLPKMSTGLSIVRDKKEATFYA